MRISFVRTFTDITSEFLQGTDIVVHEASDPHGSPWCHNHTLNSETADKVEKELGWHRLEAKAEKISFYAGYSGIGILKKLLRLFPELEVEEPPSQLT